MSESARRVRVSFAGAIGEPPTLIDLTLEFDERPPLQLVPDTQFTEELESFIQWTLQNDTVPRPVLSKSDVNGIAPVLVYQKSMVRGDSDDKECMICLGQFKPRMHVRRLPCGHLFCAKCVEKWVTKQSATRPTCRRSFV